MTISPNKNETADLFRFLWSRRKDEGRLVGLQTYSGDNPVAALHFDLTKAQTALECKGNFVCEGTGIAGKNG